MMLALAAMPSLIEAAPRSGQPVQGELHLRFRVTEQDGASRTVVDTLAHKPPLQIVRPFRLADGGALVHLHNLSGGVLGGDSLQTTVAVEAGARAQITTTGATRVYRQRTGCGPALQTFEARIGQDALLEYLPDPVIPYAGSAYCQQSRFVLAEGAGLFAWDLFAPGRVARGEWFAYDQLAWETTVEVITNDGLLPISIERARLTPAQRPLATAARMGPFRYLATLLVCRVGVETPQWNYVEQALHDVAATHTEMPSSWWGVSALVAHGVVVRGLAHSGHDLLMALPEFWRVAKRILYAEAAIPPRKIY